LLASNNASSPTTSRYRSSNQMPCTTPVNAARHTPGKWVAHPTYRNHELALVTLHTLIFRFSCSSAAGDAAFVSCFASQN
jgi:hypothetical protein